MSSQASSMAISGIRSLWKILFWHEVCPSPPIVSSFGARSMTEVISTTCVTPSVFLVLPRSLRYLRLRSADVSVVGAQRMAATNIRACDDRPRHHVVILTSQEGQHGSTEQLTWFHTRGMRKFGRPDLSVHNVPARYHDAVIDLIGRFIELQALGGVISEGQQITMGSLPSGMICHRQGDLDDPDFNNVHVEITMPRRY